MASSRDQPSLPDILAQQQDVVARPQLIAAGIDDRTIGRRVRRGEWQRVLPGIYRVTPGTLTLEHRRIAAGLFAGEQTQLTGAATLLWYGFRSPLATDRVHALVPHEIHRRSSGFVAVHRALSMDSNARDTGLYRVTSPARAVVDACRHLSNLQSIRAIVAEAIQRSFASVESIDSEIRRAARSRTSLVRMALLEIVSGIRSSPEAELRDIAMGSTVLPEILWNPQLAGPDGMTLPTPDGWLVDGAIALEVDSREHHSAGDGWRRTLRRSNILTELGAVVLHFTPAEIRTEPARVLRVIEQTYRTRRGSVAAIVVIGRSPS